MRNTIEEIQDHPFTDGFVKPPILIPLEPVDDIQSPVSSETHFASVNFRPMTAQSRPNPNRPTLLSSPVYNMLLFICSYFFVPIHIPIILYVYICTYMR